jgi:hypothetical protein
LLKEKKVMMFLTSAMSIKQKQIERIRRSVHREFNRPQGILHIPKAIQLRNRISCVDDVVNGTEVNTLKIVTGKINRGHRSLRAWHVEREVSKNLGDPSASFASVFVKVRFANDTEAFLMGLRKEVRLFNSTLRR